MEALKQDTLSVIKKSAIRDNGSVVMYKLAELQEAEINCDEDTHKKAFFNRRGKASTRLGVKGKANEGAAIDECASFEQGF